MGRGDFLFYCCRNSKTKSLLVPFKMLPINNNATNNPQPPVFNGLVSFPLFFHLRPVKPHRISVANSVVSVATVMFFTTFNVVAVVSLLLLIKLLSVWRQMRKLPPGPFSIPFIGSISGISETTFDHYWACDTTLIYGILLSFDAQTTTARISAQSDQTIWGIDDRLDWHEANRNNFLYESCSGNFHWSEWFWQSPW